MSLTSRTPASAQITAVVPTFNRAEYLGESLASLLAQSRPLARVIVVDDGSTDATASVAAGFGDKIEYMRLKNGGKARALNSVLPCVATEYVWFFDDDDVAEPEAAERLLDAAAHSPDAGFVFGDHDLVWASGPIDQATRVVARPYLHAREAPGLQRLRLFRECTVMMTGSILRTDAVRAVGGLNEVLIRCQDYDLMLRLAAHGPFLHVPHRVYRWRQHGGHRGTAASKHNSDSRIAAWAQYNEPIGVFLRDKVSIERFDPLWASPDSPASPSRTRLLARAWTITPKLRLSEGVEILVAALEQDRTSPLTGFEVEVIREAFNHAFVSLRPARDLMSLTRLARHAVGRSALREIARGLYWLGADQPSLHDRLRWQGIALWLSALSWWRL